MGTRKIAPALAAGCACILKPASETPLTALALAQSLADAGVPAGLVNILPARRSGAVVSAMLHDPRARVVSFTGSTEVGRQILREAADCVINPRMELGGNAPFIVFEDADLEAAVDGAMIAKMRNMGEACTAANRFYVHARVHDAFAERFAARMAALRVGYGLNEGVSVGPLVNAQTRDKVEALVADAVERGARILTGGRRGEDERGFYYLPTVLVDVPPEAACLREEIFGPVAPLCRFETENEVVALANATEYGLSAYVYTQDLARGLRLAERLEFGMVGLNRGLVSDPAAPFGGVKQSGLGREGAHEGLMEFLETQYISLAW
jgi:succinate-semialdehyde dehydrogenase/glutarate-semialdehyde dehydrogenase